MINTAKVAEAPNLASFDNRWGDIGYVAGALAGVLTKTGTIGGIGGIPVPVILEYNEGLERGAKRTRPDVKMLTAVVGSFSDVAKGKEVTLALIEKGADVVSPTGNESVIGTLEAAKEKGVLMIGTAFDSASFAPDTIVATALVNFDVNIDLGDRQDPRRIDQTANLQSRIQRKRHRLVRLWQIRQQDSGCRQGKGPGHH